MPDEETPDSYEPDESKYEDPRWLHPGLSNVANTTGSPEPVLNYEQWRSRRRLGGTGECD